MDQRTHIRPMHAHFPLDVASIITNADKHHQCISVSCARVAHFPDR